MKSANPVPRPGFRGPLLAVLAVLPVLTLALLPASGVAAVPRPFQRSGATLAAAANPSQPLRIELAGNKKRDGDDNFDPYGKDDPNSKKWGEAAGLGGNRYGGLRTGGDQRGGRNSDRDDREPRAPRGEDSGRK